MTHDQIQSTIDAIEALNAHLDAVECCHVDDTTLIGKLTIAVDRTLVNVRKFQLVFEELAADSNDDDEADQWLKYAMRLAGVDDIAIDKALLQRRILQNEK